MLKITLKELRLFAKCRNRDSYQNICKNQLINLITTSKSTLVEEESISKFSKSG